MGNDGIIFTLIKWYVAQYYSIFMFNIAIISSFYCMCTIITDCYRLRFPGYKHLFAGAATSAAGDVAACAAACARVRCGTFSFSFGGGCVTSSLPGSEVRPAVDLRADRDWDVYEFEFGERECLDKFGGGAGGGGGQIPY